MMVAITLSTTLSGRAVARTGRYKRFPIAGLALMSGALVFLAIVTARPSRTATGIGVALFGALMAARGVHGIETALVASAALLGCGAVVAVLGIRLPRDQLC